MSSRLPGALGRFDELADAYDAWFTTKLGSFVARRERELIFALLEPRTGQRIIEVGAGTGYFLRDLARSGARCVGLEPSAEMLRVALSHSGAEIEYVRGVAEALPFDSTQFDAVLIMTTLEFVQNVEGVVSEAARVVKPGGRIVLGVLNADGPWARARRREGGLWNEARFFRADELTRLLSPFGNVRLEYSVHVPPDAGSWPASIMVVADAALRRLFPSRGAFIAIQVVRASSG